MNRRQAAMASSREMILTAAGQQFARYGYEATTFARIADAMGRPKSAIGYHLFPSKLALAVAVVEQQQERWRQIVTAASKAERPGIGLLTQVLLEAALETRSRPTALGAVRLLRELLHTDVDVPRGFVWADFVGEQLCAARPASAPPLPERAEDLLLEATFGVVTSSTPIGEEDLAQRLHSLWVPLLTSFGIPDAAKRIVPLTSRRPDA